MIVFQMIKYPPAMQETWVQSLGWEDPLEKEIATPSSILAWRPQRTREPEVNVHVVQPFWVQSRVEKGRE